MTARWVTLAAASLATLMWVGSAQAMVTIDTVVVGNPGNVGEWSGESYSGYGPDRLCGAVDYIYEIGKFEVTAGQHTEFLNAVAKTDTYELYDTRMWDNHQGCKIQRSGLPGSYTYTVTADQANRPATEPSISNVLQGLTTEGRRTPDFLPIRQFSGLPRFALGRTLVLLGSVARVFASRSRQKGRSPADEPEVGPFFIGNVQAVGRRRAMKRRTDLAVMAGILTVRIPGGIVQAVTIETVPLPVA